ncbi:MAG: hypothetical protein IT223_03605, partial [Crocinitomicaceae bacterium]|nr:hypothetical protein [Crocinitomicaceae bacterium]
MKTFLRDIAEEILQRHRDHLDKIILIVPGKRAGLFLKRQLAACLGRPMVSPRVMLMPQWMEWLSGETMSNRISQNLLLYEAYLEVMGDKADPFEQFSGWSSTILSDLSDIDQELVDEESLFRDLRDVREIENWSFHQLPLSDSQVRYLAFWSELGKISAAFRKLQKKEKLIGYSGLARSLAENSPSLPEGVSHFWFVGLSSFSEAEQRIVNTFVVQNNATVRWDADVYYVKNPLHEAGRFFRQRMKKEAIGLYDLLSSNSCEFNVFECTTAIGQILSVAQHLKTLPPEEMSESVVVVIDETLLFPLIRRIPDTISDVNVALGMSLRHTSAFKFVMAAFRLHINGCRKTGEHFFFEDFAEVISEPVIVSLMGNYSIQLKNHLISNHTNLIGKSDWEGAVNLFPEWISLGFLLEKPIASSTQFIAAVKRVCLLMNEKISEDVQGTEGLAKMITVLDEFEKMIVGREYLRDISAAHAFFSQVVTNEKISFEGEAFSGLQVLGMVETRAI